MSEHKLKRSPSEVLVHRIEAALIGRASGVVRVDARLTGSVADAWRALRDAAQGLTLDDSALLSALILHGSSSVRATLRKIHLERS